MHVLAALKKCNNLGRYAPIQRLRGGGGEGGGVGCVMRNKGGGGGHGGSK